jgi:integrase
MAKTTHRLTAISTKSLRDKGLYADGNGLYLRITESGTKGWIFRFALKGRRRDMGIGTLSQISLATARNLAEEFQRLLKQGIDPIEDRKAKVAASTPAGRTMTFDFATEQFLDDREGGWKNTKHRQQWRNTLKTYASPVIGKKDVADISTADVLQILKPIWQRKAETASRVRGRIENVLEWAKVNNFHSGENPAAWRGHLAHILPARNKKLAVEHHAAMAWSDVPEFMAELRVNSAISSKALQFTILTVVRTSEAIEAQRAEVNRDAKLWIIPKERMKAGMEFRGPLSDAAIGIIDTLPVMEDNPYLFPGTRKARPLSNMAMLELLRGMRPGMTVHGFRSSFRDWAGDSTGFPRELAEMCLAHTVGDDVEIAYRRSDMIEKRRKVMKAWGAFLMTPFRPRTQNQAG